MWLMIVLQTLGAVDLPDKGPRKLPAPKSYLAIVAAWSVLTLVAETSMARAAAALGWLMVLAGMFLGPFGQVAGNVLDKIAQQFPANPTKSGPGASGGVIPQPQPQA